MASGNHTGLTRLFKAGQYTWQGICAAYRYEEAFRQEVWFCAVLLPLGIYLGDSGVEKALLAATVLLIPMIEIINSALEAVVDRCGLERHQLSGRAKDMGSAAVALSIVLMVLVWVLVLFA